MINATPEADSALRDDHRPQPDAQGEATFLLIESPIHSLPDNGRLKSLDLLNTMQNNIRAHFGRYDPAPEAVPDAAEAV